MPSYDITKTITSDMTNVVDDVTVDTRSTDGVSDQKETIWQNSNWTEYYGYFYIIPDLQSAVMMKSVWNVGKGYKTNNFFQSQLDNIRGWGKDTFQDILFNMDVISQINEGGSYAQIIRNDKTGTVVNLKVLDPGSIEHIVNEDGILTGYQQISKTPGKKPHKFKAHEIFHLVNNRVADNIHSTSIIPALKETIDADNESFQDIKRLMHHQVKPFILWKLKTNDNETIAAFKAKVDIGRNTSEDLYIPDDDNAVTHEVIELTLSSLIFEWRNDIRNKFYRVVGLPQVVPGAGGGSTESETKVIYFAFEQIVEFRQSYLERQIWAQLGIRLNLIPPSTLSAELGRDEAKDAGSMAVAQPGETKL